MKLPTFVKNALLLTLGVIIAYSSLNCVDAQVKENRKNDTVKENSVLFLPVKPELTDKQTKILNRIKKEPWTRSVYLVEFHKEVIGDKTILLCLDENTKLKLSDYTFSKSEIKFNKQTIVELSVTDDSCAGMIYHKDSKYPYAVEPLGGKLHVISSIDQSKLPSDGK